MTDLLHRWHMATNGNARAYVVLEEVAPGTGWMARRWADVLVLSIWPSNGLTLDGFEVKASREDLKRELTDPDKHQATARYCDTWSLLAWDEAVMKGLDIPAEWGLWIITGDEDDRMPPMADTKKVVINVCYGGFSLSPRAVARMAEIQGRECYFFVHPKGGRYGMDFDRYERVSMEEAAEAFMWVAFDVPTPPDTLHGEAWAAASQEERQASNARYRERQIDNRDHTRDDALLVQVVEELGEAANGKCAELRVVEIPADVEFVIEEYDGTEHIAEAHRTWR